MSFQDIASRMRKHADEKAAAEESAPPNFEELYLLRARILGVLVRDAREAAGITPERCAEQIGVKIETYTAWELGKEMPSLPQLELLAYALNMPISHFWGNETMLRQTEHQRVNPQDYILLRTRLIGALLRSAREQNNLTVEDLADAAGVTAGQVTDYELGQRPIPTPILVSLASACRVNLGYFLENGNRVGTFLLLQEDLKNFSSMPDHVRHFISSPVNQPYIELAMKLSKMGTDELRSIAEAILDITL